MSSRKNTKRYTTNDGHRVRSRAEVIIDNLLHDLGISHEYEKPLTLAGTRLWPDWFLPSQNAIIEFWGLEDQPAYVQKQVAKLKLYAEHNLPCLSLNDEDLSDSQQLADRLRNFAQQPPGQIVPSGPLNPEILAELRQGRRCYFCKQPKDTPKHYSLCERCYSQVQAKSICALCGEGFGEPIEDSGPYDVWLCDDCAEKVHELCKICGGPLTDGTWKGKSLCAACYVAISRVSSGLHTSKHLRRRAGRQIRREIRDRYR